jgi:hypothetical protein
VIDGFQQRLATCLYRCNVGYLLIIQGGVLQQIGHAEYTMLWLGNTVSVHTKIIVVSVYIPEESAARG